MQLRPGLAEIPANLLYSRSRLRLPKGTGNLIVHEAFAKHGGHLPQGSGCSKKMRSAQISLLGKVQSVNASGSIQSQSNCIKYLIQIARASRRFQWDFC
jgi:hypothetical protein